MRHFRPLRPKDRRELQRIKSSQGKVGSAIGKGSEDFFKRLLKELYQEGRIKGFRKTRKWSSDDYYGGTDFFISSLDGREYRVDIKSSETWIGRKKPGVIYIIVGLHPDKKRVLKQLRMHKIISREAGNGKLG